MRSKVLAGVLAATVVFLLATNPVVSSAAGQITGHQIKNNSITGKDIKNSSLSGGDVKDGSLGADALAPAVQAELKAPAAPQLATPIELNVPASAPPAPLQPAGQVGALALTTVCQDPDMAQPLSSTAELEAASPGSNIRLSRFNIEPVSGGSPVSTTSSVTPSTGASAVLVGAFGLHGATDATSTFTWSDSTGVYSGILAAHYDGGTHTCRVSGWILHP